MDSKKIIILKKYVQLSFNQTYTVNRLNNVYINNLGRVALEDQPLEIVERKGLGHPDTICDTVMNQISIELSKYYIKKFDVVLHHNVDKSLLAAGVTMPKFKGGEIIEPMTFIFGDRATFQVGDEIIPVNEIASKSAAKWLKENIPHIDVETGVIYQSQIRPGSIALADIFERRGEFLGSNDTSAAVGYGPLTRTESLILDLEKHLNSHAFKKQFPESGQDIKLMGLRKNNSMNVTVAMAMIDQYIESVDDYFKKRVEIHEAMDQYVKGKYGFKDINLDLNALDVKDRGKEGLYLTVTGTSAEAGDSGQVGRGNNVVGVIPLNRPMSAEAAAGKNPVSHVGKIYNALCYRIANRVINDVNGVKEIYIWLLSQIGRPINDPSVVSAQLILDNDEDLKIVTPLVDEIIAYEFEHLAQFCDDLANGLITIC